MTEAQVPAVIQRRYRYVRDLGKGGMGRVVLVQDLEEEGVERALKWVPVSDPPSRRQERHLREFRILSRFLHPHLLSAFHFGRVEPELGQYFTCEYMAGPTLDAAVGELNPDDSLTILVQILRGLSYLHGQGWLHADLKPANIMLRRPWGEDEPQVCLIDFGLAYQEGRPAEEKILGTVHYMPPERILGARMDRHGDLYSFGVLAYRLFTGQLPFQSSNKMAILEGHVRQPPPRPREIRPDLPEGIEELLLELLAKNPVDRPGSADDVLRRFHDHYGVPERIETEDTLLAYIRSNDSSGWQQPLESVLDAVRARLDPAKSELDVPGDSSFDVAPAEESTDQLLLTPTTATGTGMVLVRNAMQIDVGRFLDSVVQRLELLGVHHVTLGSTRSAFPVGDMVRGVLGFLPAERLRDDPLFKKLSFAIPQEGDDEARIAKRLARWLGQVGARYPFVVFAGQMEEWGQRFFSFFDILREQADSHPGLEQILWVGFHGRTLPLMQAVWVRRPENRSWLTTVPLEPLDPEALSRWFRQRFRGWQPSKDILYLLEEESEGNPVLLEKILASLVQEGLLVRDWDGWSVESFGAEQRRSPLVIRVAAAYSNLDPSLQEVLNGLVVLGGTGDAEWVGRVYGQQPDAVRKVLEQLVRGRWIDREMVGVRFRFRHPFQQKVVRQSMCDELWLKGNRRVARWLLAKEKEGKAVDPDRLAGHLLDIGEARTAVRYARQAVKNALRQGRILAAIRWLERLLAEPDATDKEARVQILEELADLRNIWGPPGEVQSLRRKALDLHESVADDASRGAVLTIKLAESVGLSGDVKSALEYVNSAIPTLDVSKHGDTLRRAFLDLAELGFVRGTAGHLGKVWQALDRCPKTQRTRLVGQEMTLRCRYHLAMGDRAKALQVCAHGHKELTAIGSPGTKAWIRYLAAIRLHLEGSWLHAIAELKSSAQQFARRSNTLMQGRCLLDIGELYLDMWRFARAEEYLERAESLLLRVGSQVDLPRLHRNQGRVLAQRGWENEALEKLAHMRKWASRFPFTEWTFETNLAKAEILVGRGRIELARQLLENAAHPRSAPQPVHPSAWVRWGIASQRLAVKCGQLAEVMEVFRTAATEVARFGDPTLKIPLWIEQWRVLHQLGCRNEAEPVRARLEEWVATRPEFELRWRIVCGELPEEELMDHGEAEELAIYYRNRGISALRDDNLSLGLFLLDEAQHHARRVRAMPLEPLISARLAVFKPRAPDINPEPLIQRAWKQIVRSGVVEGKIELLALWAYHRELSKDFERSRRLWAAARRQFVRWKNLIPHEPDEALLACTTALDRKSWLAEPVPAEPITASE